MAGFVEFFYNIIPGGLFLIAIYTTFNKPFSDFLQKLPSHGDSLTIAVFVIVSLFLGFAFQMINSYTHLNKIEDALSKKYREDKRKYNKNKKNVESNYDLALRRVEEYGVMIEKKDNESEWLKPLHYYMDDYLRFNNTSSLHNFFHVRISFWANTTAASFIYAFTTLIASLSPYISISKSSTYILLFVISIFLALACFCATRKSQEIFCDFVLKTFLMATGKEIKPRLK